MEDYFEESYDKVFHHEGGFVDDPDDRGGMTFMGISRRFWPDELLWGAIDEALDAGGDPNDLIDQMRPLVGDFYRREFWNKGLCDRIGHKELASSHFDFFVNAGARNAFRALQVVANAVGGQDLDEDGLVGPATRAAVDKLNGLDEQGFERALLVYNACRTMHYVTLARKDASQRKFIKGWLNRVLTS